MFVALEAIEILQGALTLADFLEKEEREQVLRRIAQLQRRNDDPRTFIAFVGEKKAGKSSLLKMLTGIPLPTAVRECTAAICLIQLGLDWYHMANLQSGEMRTFEALDDTKQHRLLRLARQKDKLAAEMAVQKIQTAESRYEEAKDILHERIEKTKDASDQVQQNQSALEEAEEQVPFLWSVWKNFSWISPAVRSRLDDIEQKKKDIEEAKNLLQQTAYDVAEQERITAELVSLIPEKWKEAKEAAMLSKQDVDDAKNELKRIAQDNKDKFAQEIQELIDVEYEAAERVEILTPDVDIPCDIVLLDTPGFNTDLPAHRRRAWEAIEEMADVCILVSDIRQPMPETALKMLRRIAPFCPYMHLALTKSDLALEEASLLQEDPEQEIAEAKQVAKSRVRKYWDGDMNIWVVAANGDSLEESRSKFRTFWDSIPSQARKVKSRKLGAYAIGELVDMLEIHILLLQEKLQQFDEVSKDIASSVYMQLEGKTDSIKQDAESLINRVRKEMQERIDSLEEKWVEQVQQCETKSEVKKTLDRIQLEMDSEAKECAQLAENGLLSGIQQAAIVIWGGDPKQVTQLIPQTTLPTPRSGSKGLWVLTAGGAAAGVAAGWVLTGTLTVPLLIAAGAGGIASLMLSPLAEAKEKAQQAITKGMKQARNNIMKKFEQIDKQVESEIQRFAQEQLQADLEGRRSSLRKKQVAKIQTIQELQRNLEKSKISFLLNR
jgi:hypothetical protein